MFTNNQEIYLDDLDLGFDLDIFEDVPSIGTPQNLYFGESSRACHNPLNGSPGAPPSLLWLTCATAEYVPPAENEPCDFDLEVVSNFRRRYQDSGFDIDVTSSHSPSEYLEQSFEYISADGSLGSDTSSPFSSGSSTPRSEGPSTPNHALLQLPPDNLAFEKISPFYPTPQAVVWGPEQFRPNNFWSGTHPINLGEGVGYLDDFGQFENARQVLLWT